MQSYFVNGAVVGQRGFELVISSAIIQYRNTGFASPQFGSTPHEVETTERNYQMTGWPGGLPKMLLLVFRCDCRVMPAGGVDGRSPSLDRKKG
jgi:hypothetical protein